MSRKLEDIEGIGPRQARVFALPVSRLLRPCLKQAPTRKDVRYSPKGPALQKPAF